MSGQSTKERFIDYIHRLQDNICTALENEDGLTRFKEDKWERDGGGGGKTRVIENGKVFEKGGVNTSVVYGELPETMQKHFGVASSRFFACGISLVIHPKSPMVPTVHANYRYFELYEKDGETLADSWFGGGADLTPYYVWQEDPIHFHSVMKEMCDRHHPDFYARYKKQCDEYFFNHHRGEARGIGGLFFDYLRPTEDFSAEQWFDFVTDAGSVFTAAYLPIVQRRKEEPYSEEQRYFQEIRRGRYVEFNLLHDRGTLFGLKTNGRIESILMSLPPRVRWDYNFEVKEGSREAETLEALKAKDWLQLKTV